MKIIITGTHEVELIDPIIEVGERTIDDAKAKTFTPMVVFVDSNDERKRYAQYLPPQPYVNDTWTDEDVANSVNYYVKSIEVK